MGEAHDLQGRSNPQSCCGFLEAPRPQNPFLELSETEMKYNESHYFGFQISMNYSLNSVLLQLRMYQGEIHPLFFLSPSVEGKYDLTLLSAANGVMVTFKRGRGEPTMGQDAQQRGYLHTSCMSHA